MAKGKSKSTKLKFNVSGEDFGSAEDYLDAPVGVYQAKIEDIGPHKKSGEKKATSLKVQVRPVKTRDGKKLKEKYGSIWKYIGFGESSAWLYAQLLEALGIATKKKRKGEWDPSKVKGNLILIRVKAGTAEDGKTYRPEIGAFLPLPDDLESDDDEDEDELEDDEEEDEEDDDEEDESDEDDEEDDDEEDEEEDDEDDDYNEWSLPDLRKEAVKRKLLKKAEAQKKKTATLVRLLEQDDAENDEDEDEEEVDEDEENEDEEDDDEDEADEEEEDLPYDEWELSDLREEAIERKLIKKKDAKNKKKAGLIKLLEKWDEEQDDEDEDDDDDDSPPF